jgi:hypothetical protein
VNAANAATARKLKSTITRKISCCSKAANAHIPRSIDHYVTGVCECSQRRYGAQAEINNYAQDFVL